MNRIVINLDEWKKKNAKKTGTLEDYTFQEIKNFLYPVAKNMYSADRQEKDYLYDMIKDYPHYEHDGVCTFLAVDMETLVPEFPDPVFVDIRAKISWGFSKDTLFNTANYNLAKFQFPLHPLFSNQSLSVYALDTYQNAVPNYLCSCIFQIPFLASVYNVFQKPFYILPLFSSASYLVPVPHSNSRISVHLLQDLADKIKCSEYAYADTWLKHYYFFDGTTLEIVKN